MGVQIPASERLTGTNHCLEREPAMSALGQKRTSLNAITMSAKCQ